MSGIVKIDEKISEGKRIVERLRLEIGLGFEAWAHWEALNGQSVDDRREFRDAVNNLGLGAPLEAIKRILARDTILVLYRITDPPNGERQTLCRLSAIACDARVRERMISRDWLIQEGWPEFLIESELEGRPDQFDRILERVPAKWSEVPPRRSALYTLRSKLKPVRDRLLAHIVDDAEIEHARVREIRSFMKIVAGLVAEADLLFWGRSSKQWHVKLNEAKRLWSYLSLGPIEARNLMRPNHV